MAAYRADIQIGVSGQQELERLRSAITQTSQAAESLNRIRVNGGRLAQSLENYNTQLERAQRNLQTVATASLAENKAITEYVTALGSANAARARQNDLIEDEIRLQQTAGRVARLAAAGIRETSGTAQLGPGPASPVGSLVGQKSPVAEKINQTLQARKDEIQLQAALLRLEEKSAAVLNEKLELQQRLNRAALAQGKLDVETVSAQQTQRQQFLAGKSGTAVQGPLAGPGAMGFPVALSLSKVEQHALETAAKKQEILQRMVATKQALVGLASNLQQIERNAANTAAANAVQDKIAIADAVRLNAVKLEELNITQRIRATEAAASDAARQRLAQEAARRNRIQNAGFGVQGPAAPPSFSQRISNPSSKLGSAVIGGGFPALMGGGPGTIAGGAIGGLVGGFAGSIGGSAIGQFLDTAIQKVQQLGNAINTLNFDKVTESGVRLTGELRTQLDLLIKAGQAQQAQQLVSQEIAAVTGTPVGTTEDIANAVNLLNVAFNSVVSTVSTLLGIIGAPFVAALAAALQVVNLIVKGLNVTLGFVGSLIKDVGEWVVALVGGEDAVANIERGLAGVNGQFDEAIAKANQLRIELNQAVVTASQNLKFESRMTPGSTAGEKLTNNDVELEKKLASLTTDRLNATIKIREENKEAELAVPGTIAGLVQQNNQAFDLLEKTERLVAARRAESIQIQENTRLAREAAQAAEKAQRQAEARTNSLLQIEKEIYSVDLQRQALNIQQTRIAYGTDAALQREFELSESKKNISQAILNLEKESALVEAAKLGTTAQVIALYGIKLDLLNKQLETEKFITDQAQRQRAVDKFTAAQTAVDAAVKPVQDFLADQEQEVRLAKIYSRLLMEGVLPAEAQRQVNFEKIVSAQLRSLDTQIATTKATIAQAEYYGLAAAKVDELTEALTNLETARAGVTSMGAAGPGVAAVEATPAEKVTERIGKLKEEVAELTNIGNIAITVADGIGVAFSQAFQGLISGSMSAQEALGSFFKSVGDMFVSMATEIIAKQMTMIILQTILKALGAAVGGGGGGFKPLDNAGATNFSFNPSSMLEGPGFMPRAGGGPAAGGTPYLVGERGPELFVPGSNGGVMSNNDLRSAMNGQGGGAAGSPVLNMSFESTTIGGVEYVSRDQLEQAMAETRRSASRDGAQRGMTMTLDRIQNSSSTRRRIGV